MANDGRTLREGLVVGFIAYLSVAAFYALFDLLAARGALFTVDLLGKAVFQGLRDPTVLETPIQVDTGAILWYNALHLVVSLLIGVIVTQLVDQAERFPSRARLVLFTLVAGFVVTVVGIGMLSTPIRPLLPWWSIVLANAVAVLASSGYILRKHPGIWRRLVPMPG